MTGRTILVVDDDDSIREVTRVSLEVVGGWRVVEAASGQAGLAAAHEHRPDAVLLDVMMPDVDGPTTFRAMQEAADLRDIPVILLTAKLQVADRQLWDDLAISGVISKPFDPMSLHVEIARILGWDR